MPYKIPRFSVFVNNPNDPGEVALRVRVGRGKESRIKPEHIGYIKRIQHLRRTRPKSIQKNARCHGRSCVVRNPSPYAQRVLVKSRLVKNKTAAAHALANHLRYLQRDGVGINGETPKAFDAVHDIETKELNSWAEEWGKDRHHFRFIVSPESGELDLKKYARDLITKMEKDLSTKLEWVGVAHYNTGQPHLHLLIRGKDDLGSDLIIARDYISNGIRNRAQEIATRELGYRTEHEIVKAFEKSLTEPRPCRIDNALIEEASKDSRGFVDVRRKLWGISSPFEQNKLRRLAYLEEIGLAQQVNFGLWKIDQELISNLRLRATKGDIVKTMHLRMRGIDPNAELVMLDSGKSFSGPIKGTVLHKGLSDELFDTKYLIVRGENLRAYYVPLSKNSEVPGGECEVGDRISLRTAEKENVTRSDENIAKISNENGGRYDLKAHVKVVTASNKLPFGVTPEQYVLNYGKRMRSLNRMGLVRELSAGIWEVPKDLLEQLRQRRSRFIAIETLERKRGQELGLGL